MDRFLPEGTRFKVRKLYLFTFVFFLFVIIYFPPFGHVLSSELLTTGFAYTHSGKEGEKSQYSRLTTKKLDGASIKTILIHRDSPCAVIIQLWTVR
jgi:hypothetical protein